MAAQFTEITLEDLDKFLKRGFRALKPKQAVFRGEYAYLLNLSPNVRIQILTAISRGAASTREVGTDTIKLMLVGGDSNRPLMAGKGSSLSMKRTQGWKTTLQNRIEDLVEVYEERLDYWEQRAGGASRPEERSTFVEEQPGPPPDEEVLQDQPLRGTFTQMKGDWAARLPAGGGRPGFKATLVTREGRSVSVILVSRLWKDQSGPLEIWSIEKSRKVAAEIASFSEYTYDYRR